MTDYTPGLSIASIAIAIIAISLSLYRFKRELTVIGPQIKFINILDFEIDADHSAIQERTRWHYQFELIFKNHGDRNGMMLIDKIESNFFDAIALMENRVRHLRKFPIKKMIQPEDFLTIKLGSYAIAFPDDFKSEELIIHYRTWKKIKKRFRKGTEELISSTESQKIRLNKPKRRREGIIERLKNNDAEDIEKSA